MTADARQRVVVIGPPPTPNGDLHIGHIAGPYLAGDVYARYLRATGQPVIYATGTDDSQTYVVATARRQRRAPEELCRTSWHDIQRTLAVTGIAVDGFAPFDDGYRATVRNFVTALYTAGKFRLRRVPLPYSERAGEFMVEGLVCGHCPTCLSESRGGLCETCGHPIDFGELINPRPTAGPDEALTLREAAILVFPMEEYRERLTAYYASRGPSLRPRIVQLVREVLERPLPDFPITYPVGWGIPAPFPETAGQVLNAWVEGMPASMYCTAYAARRMGERCAADELWHAGHDAKLVYFLGFDNAYFWGMNHLALLMACEGRYVIPAAIVSNEFYELENEKFSTSKGHVVWAADLLAEVPRDLVRFYLALTCPEHQRTNFSRAALRKIAEERLVGPWNELAVLVDKAAADLGGTEATFPVSAAGTQRARVIIERFRTCYELTGFSLARAADVIAGQVGRLRHAAHDAAEARTVTRRTDLGDVMLEVKALIAGAAPIMVDLAGLVAGDGGSAGVLTAGSFAVGEIRYFPVPTLSAEVRPGR